MCVMKHCLPLNRKMWDSLPWPNTTQCQPHLGQAYTDHCLTSLTTGRPRRYWMLFPLSFVLSVIHCRSIQIVCSACYSWCYKITIQKWNLAVQYSMYLNVCCAININVYNIFYNTEGADLIVRYDLTFRKKSSFEKWLVHYLYVFPLLISIGKALKGFTVSRCTCSLMFARGKTQQRICLLMWIHAAFLSFFVLFF